MFKPVASAELRADASGDPDIRAERRLWQEYSLAGMFPMLIPEWIPDEVIGDELRKLEQTCALPWSIPDNALRWNWASLFERIRRNEHDPSRTVH